MANQDLRQQILLSLRAEGIGEADRCRQAMAQVEEEMQGLSKAFVDGTLTGGEYRKMLAGMGADWNFFNGLVKQSTESIHGIDVGLNELQITALKFGDAYREGLEKAARAAEELEIKQAEALAKSAAKYEQWVQRQDVAAEAAELKDAERQAKMVEGYERMLDREQAAADAAELKDAERQARMAEGYERMLAREQADAEAAELKEAERVAKMIALHEQGEQRELAAAVVAQERRDDLLAKQVQSEIAAAEQASRAREAALTADMVPLSALQNSGLQLQETLRKANMRIAEGKDGMELAAGASQKFSMGLLNVAHGVQDLQYGFGAFVNNIPLIVQSMGGGAGLAGTVMLVGVGVTLLTPKVKELGAALGELSWHFSTIIDPAKQVATTVDQLTAQLDRLKDKPHKIEIDYATIDQAEKKLSILQAKLAEFESHARDKTPLQEQVSREVSAIVSEYAGGTDDVSGSQNIVNLLEVAARNRGQTQFGGEFLSHEVGFERFKRRTETRDALAERKAQGESLWNFEEQMLRELNSELPELERTMAKAARDRLKVVVSDAMAGREGGISTLINMFNRDPNAMVRPGGGLTGVDPEFATMLDQARGVNVKARNEEESAERAAQSGLETDKFIRKLRGDVKKQRATEEKAMIDQVAGIDADNLKAHKDWLAHKKVEEREVNERQQEVNRQASIYGGPLGREQGPGSLPGAILDRLSRGQGDAEILAGLSGKMRGDLAGQVQADMVDDVADKIISDATAKVRAAANAAGGTGALGAERRQKVNRADAAEQARQGRERVSGFEQAMAQDIFQAAGGALNEEGAMHAAHKAVNDIKQGRNAQEAAWSALFATLQELGREAAEQRAAMFGMNQRVNMLGAQTRRNRAQRASPLPTFP